MKAEQTRCPHEAKTVWDGTPQAATSPEFHRIKARPIDRLGRRLGGQVQIPTSHRLPVRTGWLHGGGPDADVSCRVNQAATPRRPADAEEQTFVKRQRQTADGRSCPSLGTIAIPLPLVGQRTELEVIITY